MFKEDQVQRKKRSEEILESKGIPFISHLPYVDSESDVTLRSPREVAERIIALAHTNLVAFGSVTPEWVMEKLQQHQLTYLLTPKEREFLDNPTPQRKMYETWKVEAIWLLLWSLNIVDELPFPDKMIQLQDVPRERYPVGANVDLEKFIEDNTALRSKAEILDSQDIYYRFHWACVEYRLQQKEMKIVNPDIVYERIYALNWLTCGNNEEWDNVDTSS